MRPSLRLFCVILLVLSAMLWLAGLAGSPSLSEGPATTVPTMLVRGQVVSREGPIAGARVRIKASRSFVLTDEGGRFSLPRRLTAGATVTAAKEGYLIGGMPAGRQPLVIRLEPLPAGDWPDYAWVDPTPAGNQAHNCGNCHRAIYDEWKSSGHASAAVNRRLLNLYDGSDWHGRAGRGWSLLGEHPDGAAVCASCHAPTIAEDSPAFDDIRKVRDVAAQGVHCDLCHKIHDVHTDHVGLAHGRFALELLRPAEGQLFFGPLDDVDRGEDAFSPLQGESRFCSSCHEGVVFGVHVYGTYSEWLDSPAGRQGRQCQDCHMAPTGRMTNIAPGAGGVERPAHTLAGHGMLPGGRRAMLERCLKLSVHLEREPAQARVVVELAAEGVGHRVPTGYIDRHLLLVVEPFDSAGQRLELLEGSRLPDPAGEELAGLPGRLYAKLLTDPEGNSPAPFWRAGCTMADTRLFPSQPDRSRYLFPAPLDHVRVRIIYRRFWPQVSQEKSWPPDQLVIRDEVFR